MWPVSTLDVRSVDGGSSVLVLVKPRSSRSRVLGVHDGAIAVAVAAPPVDGAANEELVRTLARHLGVRPGAVRVVAGTSGRRKRVAVEGLEPDEIRGKIAP